MLLVLETNEPAWCGLCGVGLLRSAASAVQPFLDLANRPQVLVRGVDRLQGIAQLSTGAHLLHSVHVSQGPVDGLVLRL